MNQDSGDVGPAPGEPVTFHWPAYRHLSRFVVWPVLLLLLLRPVNRKPGLWKIVIPAAIIQLFILGMEVVAPEFCTGGLIVYVDEFNFVAEGFAFLWLLSGILRNLGTFLLPLVLTVAMIGVG